MKTVAYKGAKGDQLRIYWKDHVKRSADLSFRSRYSVSHVGRVCLCRYSYENGRQESFGISLEIETAGLSCLIVCGDKGKGGKEESAQVF